MSRFDAVTPEIVAGWVRDARQRTMDLVEDLDDDRLMGPRLDIVNPLLWEIGHVAWFHEVWILRGLLGRDPLRPDADALWDSMAVPHDTRWTLPLPSRSATLSYLTDVRDAVADAVGASTSEEMLYRTQYCVFHEDMHTEAFTYTRQTLGYPAPAFEGVAAASQTQGGACPGDVPVTVDAIMLGADPRSAFAFDNEKWAHPVPLDRFAIARGPVTQAEFAEFVDDGGYARRELWSGEGWAWRESERAGSPVYWDRDADGGWLRRDFDRWVPLEPHRPVVHVNWHEANAYCRWAGRRLPTEAEWEAAAAASPGSDTVPADKPRFPWGGEAPGPERANVDAVAMGCVDVGAAAAGDSALGCRQMIGNVWEWTASVFEPFPAFQPDFYAAYSEPWFTTRRVLRGGAWATRGRLLWTTWRNFYEPHRRDVLAGFRTCARVV